MSRLVLIGGMPRSGTTLAQRIIGSHSKIAIPVGEFKFFHGYASGKSVKEILTTNRWVRLWGVDLSDLYSREHQDAFINTLVRYTESVGKEIPGEKSPRNEFYYDIIQEWLKDFELKFIHLVRNPFDVMASYKYAVFHGDRRSRRPATPNRCRNWCRSVAMGLARAHFNPEEYHLLKYEDLIADPISTTLELGAFLGVDFEKERMLSGLDFRKYKDHTSFPQTIRKGQNDHSIIRPVESRKHHLTDSEIHLVGSICGELAWALGYDDEDFRPFPLERPSEHPDSNIRRRLGRVVRKYILSGAHRGPWRR